MPTIRTVKPAGGGDFSTLAAWETFAGAQATADQEAECFGGGDMGIVFLGGWTGTPDANNRPRIFAADGERHDGSDSTSGAHLLVTSFDVGVQVNLDFVRVEGLGIEGNTSNSNAHGVRLFAGTESNLLLDGLLVDFSPGTDGNGIFVGSIGATISGNIIRNCIVVRPNGTAPGIEARILTFAGSESHGIQVLNCTVYSPNASVDDGFLFTADAVGGTATLNATCENCIAMGNNGLDFNEVETGGGTPVVNLTANNNLSDDATADDFGGTGHVINETDTDVFVDPASNDFNLKAGSAAIGAGLSQVSLFTEDAVGNKYNPAVWDMGALALPSFVPLPAIKSGNVNGLLEWRNEFADPDDSEGALGPSESTRLGERKVFGIGNGSDQVDQVFRDVLTISPGGSSVVDLSGALPDPFGNLFLFQKIRAILVRNRLTADTDLLTLSGDFADTISGDTGVSREIFGSSQVLETRPRDGWTPESLTIGADGGNSGDAEVEVAVLGSKF